MGGNQDSSGIAIFRSLQIFWAVNFFTSIWRGIVEILLFTGLK
jgi:hypothetical protein